MLDNNYIRIPQRYHTIQFFFVMENLETHFISKNDNLNIYHNTNLLIITFFFPSPQKVIHKIPFVIYSNFCCCGISLWIYF